MASPVFDYLLIGGGLQNALIALAVLTRDPEARVCLVERGATLGGNHLWCFHGLDLSEAGQALLEHVRVILAQVEAVAACGVDYVKVGIERAAQAREVLDALGATGHAIVPVFIVDRGLDIERVEHACQLKFPALMVDTADKLAGSLFDVLQDDVLRRFVSGVRASGALVGVAGALRRSQLAALRALGPDFAGFRSAVCAGDRSGEIDPVRLREIAAAIHVTPALADA